MDDGAFVFVKIVIVWFEHKGAKIMMDLIKKLPHGNKEDKEA